MYVLSFFVFICDLILLGAFQKCLLGAFQKCWEYEGVPLPNYVNWGALLQSAVQVGC
jgi:hypothetical protein